MDNSRTYRVSAHPQLIQVFHKSVQNTIRSSENPQEPFCSWNSCLLALWLILSLVILLTSIVIIILSPLIQFVANARNPQTDPRIHPSDSDVIFNMSRFTPIKLSSIVPLSLLNLSILGQSVCFWSFVLEIIIPLLSKHQIIQLSYNMMPVHFFFLWLSTDTHISSVVDRPIHCWILPDNALHIQ